MAFTIDPQARPYAEEVIKRSRFIARLRYVDRQADVTDLIAEAREQERGANHHCFAYIIGDDTETRVSDPATTANRAALPERPSCKR